MKVKKLLVTEIQAPRNHLVLKMKVKKLLVTEIQALRNHLVLKTKKKIVGDEGSSGNKSSRLDGDGIEKPASPLSARVPKNQ